MKVETNSPTRESIQRTSRKMLSADDWAFQWNIDPNTARSMAYRGIPKVKNSESVNTTSSQCPLRTCIPPGKIEKKGVVMVAVPKKKKPRILMMQVTKAPIMDMADYRRHRVKHHCLRYHVPIAQNQFQQLFSPLPKKTMLSLSTHQFIHLLLVLFA